MEKGNRLSGIFWLILSFVIAEESYRLGVGNLHSPQAGFLPFVASVILGVLSLLLLLSTRRRGLRGAVEAEDITFNKRLLLKVVWVIFALFLYAIFLDTLGFVLVSMLLIAFLLRIIEPQKWYVVALGTFLIPVFAYLLFDHFLKVQLPRGIFSF